MDKTLAITILDFESYHDNGVTLYFGDLDLELEFCPETGSLVADEDTLFKLVKEEPFELYVAGQKVIEADLLGSDVEPEIESGLKTQLIQAVEEKLYEMKDTCDYEKTLDSMRGRI